MRPKAEAGLQNLTNRSECHVTYNKTLPFFASVLNHICFVHQKLDKKQILAFIRYKSFPLYCNFYFPWKFLLFFRCDCKIPTSSHSTNNKYPSLQSGWYFITVIIKWSGIGSYYCSSYTLLQQFPSSSVSSTSRSRWLSLTFWWICFSLRILW